MSEEPHIIRFPRVREDVAPFCPACFMLIESDRFEVEPNLFMHWDPRCIMRWCTISPGEKDYRRRQIDRLHNDSLWVDVPTREGNYWARRPGCGTMVNVEIERINGQLIVKCGKSAHTLENYENYVFIERAAA